MGVGIFTVFFLFTCFRLSYCVTKVFHSWIMVPMKTCLYDQMWIISGEVTWGNIFMKTLHPADAKEKTKTNQHTNKRSQEGDMKRSNKRNILGTICYFSLLYYVHTYSQHCPV